jgi:hypothetical protein
LKRVKIRCLLRSANCWRKPATLPNSGNIWAALLWTVTAATGVAHFYLATGAYWVQPIDADDVEEQELLLLTVDQLESALVEGQFRVLPWTANVALAILQMKRHTRHPTSDISGSIHHPRCRLPAC